MKNEYLITREHLQAYMGETNYKIFIEDLEERINKNSDYKSLEEDDALSIVVQW